jgi:hypothetical protein
MLSESANFEPTISEPVTSKVTHIGPPTYDVNASGPWWLNLDPDFYRSSEQFEMRFGERLKVMTTAAAGEVFKTLTSTLLAATIGPGSSRGGVLSSWQREDNIFLKAAISGDPSILFGDPPTGVRINTSKARGLHFRPKRGFRQRLRFESPYQPHHDSVRHRFSDKRNRVAHALHWRHKDKPRPTIIGIHGFNADPFTVNQQLFALPWFYELGCDVMLFTLPFHGARRPHNSLFSGQHFFHGGPTQINESFGQSICDLRVIIRYLLDDLGVPNVGVTGISLGGNTAALLACTEPRLHFSMPNVPVVSLGDLLLEWRPIGDLVQRRLKKMGATIYDLRAAFAAVSPLSYPSLLPKEQLFIIAGAGDRMASPKQARLLHDHWGQCGIHWFPGNHILHFDRGAYLRQMARVMNKIGFLEDDRDGKR